LDVESPSRTPDLLVRLPVRGSSAVNLRVDGLVPIDELAANFPVSTDLDRPHAHAKLNDGQHSATILKTRPIYAPNTFFGIFDMCFYKRDLRAASLWRDRPWSFRQWLLPKQPRFCRFGKLLLFSKSCRFARYEKMRIESEACPVASLTGKNSNCRLAMAVKRQDSIGAGWIDGLQSKVPAS